MFREGRCAMVRKFCFLAVLPILAGAGGSGLVWGGDAPQRTRPVGISSSGKCRECHNFPSGTSHPLGGRPWTRVDLPLENGGLGCLTCHDERTLSPLHAAREGNSYLRRERALLCRSCHIPGPSTRGRLVHGLSGARAHMLRRKGTRPAPGGTKVIDQESRRCLGCHDGTLSRGESMGRSGPATWERLKGNHPIGVPYGSPNIRRAGRDAFRPIDSLPREIDLPGGRVGCASCHSLYNRNPNLLVVPNRGSRLCLSCHIK